MVRAILGVVVGYIVMAVVVMGLFIGLWFALGVDGVLQPGQFKGTMALNIGAPLISIIGAMLGGFLCAKIARACTPVFVFAAIVLVLGLVAAYFTIQKPEPGPRAPGLSVIEAIQQGREPNWYALLNPFLGAVGVLMGGCGLCRGKRNG